MGKMEDKPQIPNKLSIKSCNQQHKDCSSDDDYDDMDDLTYYNSEAKGCWAKNKTRNKNSTVTGMVKNRKSI